MSVERVFLTAAGFGELVLDGPCLKLDGEHTIIWPAGFTPHVEDGVVQVRNGAGRTIAKVGDEIAGGGGYHKGGYGECRGEVFRIYGIKVLPNVEIYFPKQDGTLATGRRVGRFAGELAVDGKCLVADNLIRVRDGSEVLGPALLIWPDTFELNTEDGAAEILDATGQVVARVGDRVEFNALDLTYTQAREHGGLDEITPACSVPLLGGRRGIHPRRDTVKRPNLDYPDIPSPLKDRVRVKSSPQTTSQIQVRLPQFCLNQDRIYTVERHTLVTPAKAGVHKPHSERTGKDVTDFEYWIPAFAGMTGSPKPTA